MPQNVDFPNTRENSFIQQRACAAPASHRRWFMHGQQLSLCYEKARPISRVDLTEERHKLWLVFEPACGMVSRGKTSASPEEFRLSGAQVFCLGPGMEHSLFWESEAPLIELLIDPAVLASFRQSQVDDVHTRGCLSGASNDRVLWELAATVRLVCSSEDPPAIRLMEAIAQAIVRRVFTCHFKRYAPLPGMRLSEDRTQLVVDYIEENLAKDISAQQLAALAGLSRQHFTELFRNRTGVPPIEFLRQHRRIAAHRMILSGEHRMGEVAELCGFCDESHLTREFKRFFCYTPRLLRTRGESA